HVEIIEQGSWFAHLADRWRRSFTELMDRNLSAKTAGLVDAMCFNARNMLDVQTRQEMVVSGTVHIISASGLQVFVFGALLAMALRFVPISRSFQISIL